MKCKYDVTSEYDKNLAEYNGKLRKLKRDIYLLLKFKLWKNLKIYRYESFWIYNVLTLKKNKTRRKNWLDTTVNELGTKFLNPLSTLNARNLCFKEKLNNLAKWALYFEFENILGDISNKVDRIYVKESEKLIM